MTFHQQLLAQAKHLCNIDARRPQQANLRRSVSSAYYALFHFLIDEACKQWIGAGNDDRPLRQLLSRAFVHTSMKEASKAFQSGGVLPARVQAAATGGNIPIDLRTIAGTFVKTQELRHRADYDLSKSFVRSDVINAIQSVEAAMTSWRLICDSRSGRLYLVCLLVWRPMQAGQ